MTELRPPLPLGLDQAKSLASVRRGRNGTENEETSVFECCELIVEEQGEQGNIARRDDCEASDSGVHRIRQNYVRLVMDPVPGREWEAKSEAEVNWVGR